MIKMTKKEEENYNKLLSHKTRVRAWAIRAYCYQCSAYSFYEVDKCPCKDCPLYKFRHGPNVTPKDNE